MRTAPDRPGPGRPAACRQTLPWSGRVPSAARGLLVALTVACATGSEGPEPDVPWTPAHLTLLKRSNTSPPMLIVETVPGTPPRLRVAAEWEPAVGVLVSWPPYLPRQLFQVLAEDSHLFVRVDDEASADDARRWFADWGIAPDDATFLVVPGADDAAWTRDYGPLPVFTGDGRLVLGDARYDQTTPDSGLACDAPLLTPWNGGWGDRFRDYDIVADDAAPTGLAAALGLPSRPVPFVFTGGNALVDGQGGALSTCILANENRGNGLDEAALRALGREVLGLDRWALVPNFEDDGIQHIDCLLKLLDPERLLVARPPDGHPLRARYDRFVDEHLARLRTPSGRPYEILRLDTAPFPGDGLAAYTNALILNDVVYVPVFGIDQDARAVEQWQAALPGHRIRPIPFVLDDEPALPARARRMYPGRLGWRSFDALHCRTRAVWDPWMLHIALRHPAPDAAVPEVVAELVAYSGTRIADRTLLCRPAGETTWRRVPLDRGDDGLFRAALPVDQAPDGSTWEYVVTAGDAAGKEARSPPTAPAAVHRWTPAPASRD